MWHGILLPNWCRVGNQLTWQNDFSLKLEVLPASEQSPSHSLKFLVLVQFENWEFTSFTIPPIISISYGTFASNDLT
jgi:hypothetical protein